MQYCIAVSERSTWFSRSVLDNIDNGLMYITLPDCFHSYVLMMKYWMNVLLNQTE